MRAHLLTVAFLLLGVSAYAKEPKAYQSGTLLQMDSVACGVDEKVSSDLASEIGTTSSNRKTRDLLCQEYVLQAEKTVYRIRPINSKHSVLLPVGEQAQFRLAKLKLWVRVQLLDTKEREYSVVSMTPRGTAPRTRPLHI